jgi:hypothetical protein
MSNHQKEHTLMKQNRTNLFLGVLLILIGAWLVVTRQVPAVQDWMENNFTWPMWTIGAGLTGTAHRSDHRRARNGLSPASIIAGIGGILFYQNATDDFRLLGLHVDAHSRLSWAWGPILAGLLG